MVSIANFNSNVILDVNSATRTKGTPNDFTVNIKHLNIQKAGQTISLVQAAMPLSYYAINNSNNKLTVDGTVLTMPIGKYTNLQFTAALAAMFLAHNGADVSTFVVDIQTGRLIITSNPGGYVLNIVTGRSLLDSMGYLKKINFKRN